MSIILIKDYLLKQNCKCDDNCWFCNDKETIQHHFFEYVIWFGSITVCTCWLNMCVICFSVVLCLCYRYACVRTLRFYSTIALFQFDPISFTVYKVAKYPNMANRLPSLSETPYLLFFISPSVDLRLMWFQLG